jgi:hypothetical protein
MVTSPVSLHYCSVEERGMLGPDHSIVILAIYSIISAMASKDVGYQFIALLELLFASRLNSNSSLN